ncbi:unnamed protein product [Brassica rapa subsp. trilocularis]
MVIEYMLTANITTAVYLATITRTGTSCYSPSYRFESYLSQCLMSNSPGKSSGLNSFGLMWCNVICEPILMVRTYMCGDWEKTINFPQLFSPGFMVLLCYSACVLAFFFNYIIFLNTTLNSALTQTICGNMKDLFTVGLGWMIFGGLPFDLVLFFTFPFTLLIPKSPIYNLLHLSTMNVIGQLLGFFGSGLYAYYKIIGR